MVPKGRIYGVDIEPDMVKYLAERAKHDGLKNIIAMKGAPDNPLLPEKVDLVFLRNVYHHISNRVEYFGKLKESIRPDGRIAIVDHSGHKRFSLHRIFEHHVTHENIIKEMTKAGYSMSETKDFLPEHSFHHFSLKK
jgi:SAM-dependent methyltransferase